MEEVKKRDRQVLFRTLFPWYKVPLYLVLIWISGVFLSAPSYVGGKFVFAFLPIVAMVWAFFAGYKEYLTKRWYNKKYLDLWLACVDRRKRLAEALKKMKRAQVADLQELPQSADKLLDEIYKALRRADLVYNEISQSEMRTSPPMLGSRGRYIADNQAQELFKVADRNIAEYSHHFKRVMAGVERSEAQAVVFATTLDTLRVRMLGYRLTSAPEAETREFLNVVTEAKMQFEAIDQALEEIELTPFPETVVTVPNRPVTQEALDEGEERERATAELDGPPPFDRTKLQGTSNKAELRAKTQDWVDQQKENSEDQL